MKAVVLKRARELVMITHRFPLEAFQQAFDLLVHEPKEAYKVVFTMDQKA